MIYFIKKIKRPISGFPHCGQRVPHTSWAFHVLMRNALNAGPPWRGSRLYNRINQIIFKGVFPMQTSTREYNKAKIRTVRVKYPQIDKKTVQNFCAKIDNETIYLIDEIRRKYPSETNASILTKAIRSIYDRTCRSIGS